MSQLSSRALANAAPSEMIKLMDAVFSNPYSEENPNGVVFMGLAENKLMHPEIAAYINKHLSVTSKMLTYGEGPCSMALRNAMARYINREFKPTEKLEWSHVSILNGVSSVIDALCFCIADPGDGILVARPLYVGFLGDMEDRARVKPIPVSMHGTDVTSLASVARHEEALLQAEKDGIKVKALLLCSPHNPLGRCYTPEVIGAYLALCQKYKIHFISDEVYAKSVFPTTDVPEPTPFRSALSVDVKKFIDPSLVHILYGMSKDFCSNGLRIAAFISLHNPQLHASMSACATFLWASSLSSEAWTCMLNDEEWLSKYFTTMSGRLRASYETCVGMLKVMGISYIPANCGHFIWISLQHLLPSQTLEEERELAWKMVNGGVWLATGEAFSSEEPGWFRISFSVPEEELRFGMERFRAVLRSLPM